ncbi:hypothetical protein Tco_1152640 [Tanacetum coccineum]
MQVAHDRQKSYVDLKRKPMDFQVGDKVMLKVSPWKGVVRFGKRGKLNTRYVGPFKVLEKVGSVAYKLELPEELSKVHNMFRVSNLKKYYADEPLAVLLDGLHFDDKLQFIEEPVEIMDREVKWLKRSRIPIIKGAYGCILEVDQQILGNFWSDLKCLTKQLCSHFKLLIIEHEVSELVVIIEQIVKVNQKARTLELKQRNHEEHYSDNLYAISIKEDTAYPCPKLHSASTKERSIRRIQMKPYTVFKYKSWNILEYNNRDPQPRNPNTPY